MPKSALLKHAEVEGAIPQWMLALQEAARECISADDIKDIVNNQKKRAKEGDREAIKFIFGQVLGGDAMKGSTFIQNNNYGGANPAKPARSKPGSENRLTEMQRRAEAGLPLHVDGDSSIAEGEDDV